MKALPNRTIHCPICGMKLELRMDGEWWENYNLQHCGHKIQIRIFRTKAEKTQTLKVRDLH